MHICTLNMQPLCQYVYIRRPLLGHQAVRDMDSIKQLYAVNQLILAYLQAHSLAMLCNLGN